jgi:hypothetical protein
MARYTGRQALTVSWPDQGNRTSGYRTNEELQHPAGYTSEPGWKPLLVIQYECRHCDAKFDTLAGLHQHQSSHVDRAPKLLIKTRRDQANWAILGYSDIAELGPIRREVSESDLLLDFDQWELANGTYAAANTVQSYIVEWSQTPGVHCHEINILKGDAVVKLTLNYEIPDSNRLLQIDNQFYRSLTKQDPKLVLDLAAGAPENNYQDGLFDYLQTVCAVAQPPLVERSPECETLLARAFSKLKLYETDLAREICAMIAYRMDEFGRAALMTENLLLQSACQRLDAIHKGVELQILCKVPDDYLNNSPAVCAIIYEAESNRCSEFDAIARTAALNEWRSVKSPTAVLWSHEQENLTKWGLLLSDFHRAAWHHDERLEFMRRLSMIGIRPDFKEWANHELLKMHPQPEEN